MRPYPPLKRLESDSRASGFYGVSRQCMSQLIRSIWRDKFTITGIENIPATGSAILAINQTTHLDPLFVAIAFKRPVHFIGLDDGGVSEPWYTPLLYRSMGVINASDSLLRKGGHYFASQLDDAIQYGELVGIFPEGRIESKRNRVQITPFHKGVATIARLYQLAVIPVFMRGTENVIPNSTARLHEPIHVRPVSISVGHQIAFHNVCNEECVRQAMLKLREQKSEGLRAQSMATEALTQ